MSDGTENQATCTNTFFRKGLYVLVGWANQYFIMYLLYNAVQNEINFIKQGLYGRYFAI